MGKRDTEWSVDEVWDALRRVSCSTRPHGDAHAIVMLRRADVKAAIDLIRKERGGGDAPGTRG